MYLPVRHFTTSQTMELAWTPLHTGFHAVSAFYHSKFWKPSFAKKTIHIYTYIYVCVCIYMCVYICICVYMYIYVYICIYMCVYVCVCVYMCIYIYMGYSTIRCWSCELPWLGSSGSAWQILRSALLLWKSENVLWCPVDFLGHRDTQFGNHSSKPSRVLFSLLEHVSSLSCFLLLVLQLSLWTWWLPEPSRLSLGGASACFPSPLSLILPLYLFAL